jgi:hypothetical protein
MTHESNPRGGTLRRVIRAGVLILAIAIPSSATAQNATIPPVGSGLESSSAERLGESLLLDGVGAGLPSDGVAAAPSRDVQALLRAQADATSGQPAQPAAALPTFATGGSIPRSIPPESHPYARSSPIPLVDAGVHDSAGVRKVRIGSKLFDHPVAQASYGLGNLSSYDLTGDDRYLTRAIVQATRLVQTKVVSRDAWYLPYPFDFALHGRSSETLRAPWYSAMAQGLAVSLFVRLYERTDDETWSDAAAATVASFRNPPAVDKPWVVQVDAKGYLWLEEYPVNPPAKSDYTFNGHNYAIFGLYDYARLTGDSQSTQLFDGATTTTRRYGSALAPAGFRTSNWLSTYCLRHEVLNVGYHGIVTEQLRALYSMTADASFARISDAYRADYPVAGASSVRFAAGTRTGYVFDSQGRIVRSKAVVFSRPSSAPSDQYTRIIHRGLYYRITAGSFKGYWVAEQAGLVSATGLYATAVYYPERRATFRAGKTTGYRLDGTGLRSSSRQISLSGSSSAPFDRTAMFDGRRYARIAAGRLAGYWVLTSALTLE